jgi:hypothetical protein
MTDYYCHECAVAIGMVIPINAETLSLTGTSYQLDKYLKHTMPVSGTGKVSIFDDPDYEKIKDYAVTVALSGAVEVDSKGRTNLIWYAGEKVGVTYRDDAYYALADSVKVVFHDDQYKIHTFPVESQIGEVRKCKQCGKVTPI